MTERMTLTPISDETAMRIAHIIGGHSAASQALAEAERRRAAGENVGLFRAGDHFVVGPYPEGLPFRATRPVCDATGEGR